MSGTDLQHAEESQDPVVLDLLEEIWRLQAELPRVRKSASTHMRKLAVDTFRSFAKQATFSEIEVIRALESLPIPD